MMSALAKAMKQRSLRSLQEESILADIMVRMLKNPMGFVGSFIIMGIIIAGLFAPLLAPYDPTEQFRDSRLVAPSSQFLFGTDEYGRDVLSRVLYALRASVVVSLIAVGLGGSVGIFAGFVAGYAGGIVDTIVMRLVDTLLAFPGLILAIGIIAAFGTGLQSVAIALGVGASPNFARLARGEMLAQRGRDYVRAARALGARPHRIIFRQISLNALPPLLVHSALAMATAVLAEAALGFLGVGTVAPDASLGTLINEARSRLSSLHLLIFPSAALGLFLLGLNLTADAANEALDPHSRRR